MSKEELIATAKQAMKDLSATPMAEHEQVAYYALRLLIKEVENPNPISEKNLEIYYTDDSDYCKRNFMNKVFNLRVLSMAEAFEVVKQFEQSGMGVVKTFNLNTIHQ